MNIDLESKLYLEQRALGLRIRNYYAITMFAIQLVVYIVTFINTRIIRKHNRKSINLKYLETWNKERKEIIKKYDDLICEGKRVEFLKERLENFSFLKQRSKVAWRRQPSGGWNFVAKKRHALNKGAQKTSVYLFEGQNEGMSVLQQYSVVMNFLGKVYLTSIFLSKEKRRKVLLYFYLLVILKIEKYNENFAQISDTEKVDFLSWVSLGSAHDYFKRVDSKLKKGYKNNQKIKEL